MARRRLSFEGRLLSVSGASVATEDSAAELVERCRWPGRDDPTTGAVCPGCASTDTYLLGSRRGAREGARRQWRCRECHRTYSARVGSFLEGSQVSYRALLLALAIAREHPPEGLAAALHARAPGLSAQGRLSAVELAERAVAVVNRERRAMRRAGVMANLLALLAAAVLAASIPRHPLVDSYLHRGQPVVVRTPRIPGESVEDWRSRHATIRARAERVLGEDLEE